MEYAELICRFHVGEHEHIFVRWMRIPLSSGIDSMSLVVGDTIIEFKIEYITYHERRDRIMVILQVDQESMTIEQWRNILEQFKKDENWRDA